jgi:hypothetical protein
MTGTGRQVDIDIVHGRGFPARAGICCGVLIATLSGTAWPAEWSVQPAVRAAVGRESNPLLAVGTHDSATVTAVTPSMQVQGKTERSGIDLDMILNYKNYSTDQVQDTDRQILSLSSFTRLSERTKLGLDGAFRRDDLRQTVETLIPVGDSEDADVGLIQAKVRRTLSNLRPSWTRALTELSSMRLSYNFTDVRFSDAAGTGLVDYSDKRLGLRYSRHINPRDSFNITTDASRYRAAAVDNTTDTARLLVGFARAFSEVTRGSIALGASSTKEDIGGNIDHASGFVLEATATQRSEITRLDGSIRHDVSPSGIGRSIKSDQVRVRWRRGLTPKLDFLLQARLIKNNVLKGSAPTVDRRYYEVEPALEYKWTPQWALRAAYGYRYQKFDVDPTSATSNAIFIGVTYNGRRQFFQ